MGRIEVRKDVTAEPILKTIGFIIVQGEEKVEPNVANGKVVYRTQQEAETVASKMVNARVVPFKA